MVDLKSVTVDQSARVKDAILLIDRNSLQIALVVDSENHLLGTVTDGDIRRAILRGVGMDEPATSVMNKKPTVGSPEQSRAELVALMNKKALRHIPIVDENRVLLDIEPLNTLFQTKEKTNPVVIMAGGLGTRLGALTAETPKPMLSVQKKPLLESIIENLSQFGFRNIYISVNYRRDVIQNYFGSGEKHNVNIRYLEEEKPLGTAGSISLLPAASEPVLVMNADLVTTINFDHLLEFHLKQKSLVTICVRDYDIQVPFGVVKMDEKQKVLGFEEKPKLRYFVNAGIYVLDPKVIARVPTNTHMDMPTLLGTAIAEKNGVVAFPVREQWVDIGRPEDFEQANRE